MTGGGGGGTEATPPASACGGAGNAIGMPGPAADPGIAAGVTGTGAAGADWALLRILLSAAPGDCGGATPGAVDGACTPMRLATSRNCCGSRRASACSHCRSLAWYLERYRSSSCWLDTWAMSGWFLLSPKIPRAILGASREISLVISPCKRTISFFLVPGVTYGTLAQFLQCLSES